jgi:hypothetical protein
MALVSTSENELSPLNTSEVPLLDEPLLLNPH